MKYIWHADWIRFNSEIVLKSRYTNIIREKNDCFCLAQIYHSVKCKLKIRYISPLEPPSATHTRRPLPSTWLTTSRKPSARGKICKDWAARLRCVRELYRRFQRKTQGNLVEVWNREIWYKPETGKSGDSRNWEPKEKERDWGISVTSVVQVRDTREQWKAQNHGSTCVSRDARSLQRTRETDSIALTNKETARAMAHVTSTLNKGDGNVVLLWVSYCGMYVLGLP